MITVDQSTVLCSSAIHSSILFGLMHHDYGITLFRLKIKWETIKFTNHSYFTL